MSKIEHYESNLYYPLLLFLVNVFNYVVSLLSPISHNFETTHNSEIIDVSMNFSVLNKNVWIMCSFEITCNAIGDT
jgi:hypothetical protein